MHPSMSNIQSVPNHIFQSQRNNIIIEDGGHDLSRFGGQASKAYLESNSSSVGMNNYQTATEPRRGAALKPYYTMKNLKSVASSSD